MDGIGFGETLFVIVIGLLPTLLFAWLIAFFWRAARRNGNRKQEHSQERIIPPVDASDGRVRQTAAAVTATLWVRGALDEDYVGVWLIPAHLEDLLPDASPEDVRDLTEAVLVGLTSFRVHLGDFDDKDAEFLPWGPGAVSRAMEEYRSLGGRRPHPSECGWLSKD